MLTALLAMVIAAECPALGLETFNSPENEISIAFSAGLDEGWIERRPGEWGSSGHRSRLLYSKKNRETGAWSEPSPVPFADPASSEGDPFYDDAYDTLYFTSDRPHPEMPDSAANIWRVRRVDGDWGRPELLPSPVNGSGGEYSPVGRSGRLYFASYRDGGGDLYRASEADGAWHVDKLGPAVNAAGGEWNLWVSPDEDVLVFEASERVTNVTVSGDSTLPHRKAVNSGSPASGHPKSWP